MIQEIIVVEGREDVRAVKAALDCEVIATGGIRISKARMEELKRLQERHGLIILTDPDYAGKRIRELLSSQIPGCKHAYVRREEATKKLDIGVEHASGEEIRRAIALAKPLERNAAQIFSEKDLRDYGLSGGPEASVRRRQLCEELGIGYLNGKQLLKKLNGYGITRDEFEEANRRVIGRMEER